MSITSPASGASFAAPATIAIAADATDTDGSVTQVQFYSGATLIGTSTTSPFGMTWSNVPAGSYTLTAKATDNSGAVTASRSVATTVTATTPPPSGLPAPWTSQDIGAVGMAGSATFSNDTFSVKGAGADIWGSADAFQYVWQPITGDADVIARVATVENVAAWVKAGVMIRQQTSADSAHALMLVSAGNGLAFQRRRATGGVSTSASGIAGAAPVWVKLERRGNTIRAYYSPEGAAWTLVGSDTFTMPPNVYAGLAVSSHTTARLATVTFDNVAVRAPGLAAPWQTQDIGNVGVTGNASVTAGVFTVRGSGADVWGSADAFRFVYQSLAGDGTIIARLASVQNVYAWTKVGVMIRQTTDAGSTQASMFVTPGKGLSFQRRTANGTSVSTTIAGAAPYWVRLVRAGQVITASVSPDGTSWTDVGQDTIAISGAVWIGLAVTSHDNTQLATATFDNVTVR